MESAYEKTNQIGEGTYGQVHNVPKLVQLTGTLCLSVQPAQRCQCCFFRSPRPLLVALSTRTWLQHAPFVRPCCRVQRAYPESVHRLIAPGKQKAVTAEQARSHERSCTSQAPQASYMLGLERLGLSYTQTRGRTSCIRADTTGFCLNAGVPGD